MTHIEQLFRNINIDSNSIAIKSFRGRRSYTYKELVVALQNKEEIEVSLPTIKKAFRAVIDDRDKGTRSWFPYLLQKYTEYKQCNKCFKVKEQTEFNKDIHSFDNLAQQCRCCRKEINKNWHKDNYESYRKDYVDSNRDKYNANRAKRRAAEKQRIPLWAYLLKITDIYTNCLKGYHVDHIIPLQGENLSGLHVENNLQYLIAEDNLSKGNKFVW